MKYVSTALLAAPRMRKLLSRGLIACAALAGASLITAPANAIPITTVGTEVFQFTSDHCNDGGGCGIASQPGGSGGTVTVKQLSNGTLSFAVALTNGNQFINGGFEASFGFNLDVTQITYSGVSTDFLPVANPENAGTLHMDGTGDFKFGLNLNPASCSGGACNGGSDPISGPLDFTITAASALTLADLTQNANSQFFAADIISGTTGKTGGIDASSGTVVCGSNGIACTGGGIIGVPEPSSIAALGGVLVLFGLWWRVRASV